MTATRNFGCFNSNRTSRCTRGSSQAQQRPAAEMSLCHRTRWESVLCEVGSPFMKHPVLSSIGQLRWSCRVGRHMRCPHCEPARAETRTAFSRQRMLEHQRLFSRQRMLVHQLSARRAASDHSATHASNLEPTDQSPSLPECARTAFLVHPGICQAHAWMLRASLHVCMERS